GLATPAELIRDPRTTPFNIGRRIDLADFAEAEAAPLAQGLGRVPALAARLLQRVLYWTGGHPYLTQRLCQEVGQRRDALAPEAVDAICRNLFFAPQARDRDDNLLFVRDRVRRSEAEVGGLLGLYTQVLNQETVRDDEQNPGVAALRLTGLVRGAQ